jgi:triacylglycerol lipase
MSAGTLNSLGIVLLALGAMAFLLALMWWIVMIAWWVLRRCLPGRATSSASASRSSSFAKQSKGPIVLVIAFAVLWFLGELCVGDLIVNRHPDEVGRDPMQRFCGCKGVDVWAALKNAQDSTPESWLDEMAFDAGPERDDLVHRILPCARAVKLAYLPKELTGVRQTEQEAQEIIEEHAKHWGFTIRNIQKDNHSGLVLKNEEAIILSFPGTDDFEDAVIDAKFIRASSDWGAVHSGFLEATNALWPRISLAVSNLRQNDQPVWVTGHSLGGAIAIITALKLIEEGVEVAGVFTFGQPPVGDDEFAKAMATLPGYRRFANYSDPVVDAAGYGEHAGELNYFDTSGALHRLSSIEEMAFGLRLKEASCAATLTGDISPHKLVSYLTMLEHTAGEREPQAQSD